jgi:hypothetical protein
VPRVFGPNGQPTPKCSHSRCGHQESGQRGGREAGGEGERGRGSERESEGARARERESECVQCGPELTAHLLHFLVSPDELGRGEPSEVAAVRLDHDRDLPKGSLKGPWRGDAFDAGVHRAANLGLVGEPPFATL